MGDREIAVGLNVLATLGEGFIANLLAQFDHRIKNCLRPRWATGHVEINGNQLVHATHGSGGVGAEHASGDRAGAHRNHIFRLGHLLVQPNQSWSHFHRHRASNDQEVGLTWRTAGNQTEAVEIKARSQQRCEFNEATSRSVKQRPEAAETGPVVKVIQAGEDDVLAQVTGDRRGTDRTAAGFPQVAHCSDGRRGEI